MADFSEKIRISIGEVDGSVESWKPNDDGDDLVDSLGRDVMHNLYVCTC